MSLDATYRWDEGVTYTVYAYRAGSTIVYVGRTCRRPLDRHSDHKHKTWWRPAYSLEVLSTHESERDVCRAERAAIREHRPMFNVQSNPDMTWRAA